MFGGMELTDSLVQAIHDTKNQTLRPQGDKEDISLNTCHLAAESEQDFSSRPD